MFPQEAFPGNLEKERGCWGPRAHTHESLYKCEAVPSLWGHAGGHRGPWGVPDVSDGAQVP